MPKARYTFPRNIISIVRNFPCPVSQKCARIRSNVNERREWRNDFVSVTLQSRSVSPPLLSYDGDSVFQPEFLLHRSGTIFADNGSGDESCADLFPGHYGTPTSQETHRRSRNCFVQSFAVPTERMDVLESQDVPVCVYVCVQVCVYV